MIEDSRLKKKHRVCQGIVIAIFAVLALRLMTLQLVEAPVYKTKAEQNRFRFLPIRAPRGDIVDRNGKVLAANQIVNTVSLIRQQTDEKTLERTITRLAALLGDVYPEIDARYIKKLLDDHEARPYEPVVIKRDISMEVVARLEERRRELPGVLIGKEIVRYYPENTLASHVIGHIGEISQKELEEDKNEEYRPGDLVGRFGLEARYEKYLRGQDGFQQVEVDVSGRPVTNRDLITVNPKQGNNLVLTLDYDLQKVMEDALDKSLAEHKKTAGAAVVIDVRTGAILAMTSRPNFDPNALVPPVSTKAVRDYLAPPAGSEPTMLNRAISSKYPPGSTFKPITGMAALESGAITTGNTVFCSGKYDRPPYTGCWGVHRTVDFFKAMAVSCNVFFIEAGRRAGVEMLSKIAHEFRLDEKTGIDLPGEVAGSFLDPAKKKEKNLPWLEKWYQEEQEKLEKEYDRLLAGAESEQERRDILSRKKDEESVLKYEYNDKYNVYVKWQPYDTYYMAFGQGGNEYTPLGLANYVATLANGGKVMRPYLVERIETQDGKVVARFGPDVVHRVNVSEKTMDLTREAMTRVCEPGGTAYWIFNDIPIKVAAKTGTAESGRGKDLYHGVFVAFAPAENPEIAFAGIVEYGYHGSESVAPVAKEVFKEYFGLNKKEKDQEDVGIKQPDTVTEPSVQPARPGPGTTTEPGTSQPPATEPDVPQEPPQQPEPGDENGAPPSNGGQEPPPALPPEENGEPPP